MQARLTGAEWQEYARPATLRTTCTDAVDTREKALELLTNAGGDCLDKALRAVERYAKDDLAAAYLTRFERKRDPDPIDLLHALETAEGFNRALAQEWLYLTKEAIHSWNEVAAEKSGWGEEALEHRQRLQRLPDPLAQWSTDEFDDALHRRDRATLTKMAHAFPTNAARYFERSDLSDRAASRLYAEVLATTGERFPLAVVEAMEHPKDRAALEAGLAAFKKDMTDVRAAELLERAENPLSLVTRYYDADIDTAFRNLRPDYRELSSRLFMLHAFLLEGESRYLDAHPDYDQA
ncbi:MAG TPA: hypothetical protein VJZ00_15585, partial [Thermoanaerobaculia bacterium]|nr:hypothetical protein [Thermoanaerobaculia bacterium]